LEGKKKMPSLENLAEKGKIKVHAVCGPCFSERTGRKKKSTMNKLLLLSGLKTPEKGRYRGDIKGRGRR